MMEQNNSKKILLSVLGVAILIVAVVGVSFAAFSFDDTGSENSIITGTITMSFAESTRGIELKDALPMTDTDGKAMNVKATTADGQQEYFDFSVSTSADAKLNVDYTITVTPVTITTSTTVGALTNSQVKIYLEKKDGASYVEEVAPVLVSALTSATGSRTGSFVLKSDQHKHSAAGSITTDYRLRIWVDQNVDVKTDLSADADKHFEYKLLVNVDGTADVVGTGSNS